MRCAFSDRKIHWGPRSLSIAKNHLKPSQEFSERLGLSTHKMKGFGRNSPPKVDPNFAQNLGRQFLGMPFFASNPRTTPTKSTINIASAKNWGWCVFCLFSYKKVPTIRTPPPPKRHLRRKVFCGDGAWFTVPTFASRDVNHAISGHHDASIIASATP